MQAHKERITAKRQNRKEIVALIPLFVGLRAALWCDCGCCGLLPFLIRWLVTTTGFICGITPPWLVVEITYEHPGRETCLKTLQIGRHCSLPKSFFQDLMRDLASDVTSSSVLCLRIALTDIPIRVDCRKKTDGCLPVARPQTTKCWNMITRPNITWSNSSVMAMLFNSFRRSNAPDWRKQSILKVRVRFVIKASFSTQPRSMEDACDCTLPFS